MNGSSNLGRPFVVGLLLVSLGLGGLIVWAYRPILDNAFVWDDGANLVAARAKWDRGLSGLAWAFSRPYAGHYQPLTWASYQADAIVSGASPRGVHATNLLLHLCNTALVGWLGWLLAACPAVRRTARFADPRQRAALAGIAAALFGLHPIHTESVAWATERRDLLSTLFVLATLAVYLRAAPIDESKSPVRWPARGKVAFLHVLAALSRAQMTLPFVLLLLDAWPLRRLGDEGHRRSNAVRLIGEKSLSFAIAAASAAAAIWAQARAGALTASSEHGLLDRLVQAGYGLSFYPAALFHRVWLPLYERPYPFVPSEPRFLLPALAAAGALIALWLLRRRAPAVTFAFAGYALLVLPVLGIAQSGVQLVADRYAYLSTVPLVLLVAGAAVAAMTLWPKTRAARVFEVGTALALVVILGGMAAATRRQTLVWRTDESLWRHVLSHSGSCLADNNLGYLLYARGEAGPALFHLVRALDRVPTYPRPWNAIAALLEAPWPPETPQAPDSPAPPDAATMAPILERAATAQPGSALARYASALAWGRAGNLPKEELELRRVLAIEPDHEGARLALARIATQRATIRTEP